MPKITLLLAAAVLFLTANRPLEAAIEFDQDVTTNVIYGSGNTNGGWTTFRDSPVLIESAIELGLRAHVRFPTSANVFNSNGDGTYNHAAGTQAPDRALWSFDWSINTDVGISGLKLASLIYELRIDYDPSDGGEPDFQTFDPIHVPFADHSFGDNSTDEGEGVEATNDAGYAPLIAGKSLAQNSWQLNFFDSVDFPFDPNVSGIYDIELEAFTEARDSLGMTRIQVIVGDVEAGVVPEAATIAVWSGLALCGGAFTWRTKKGRQAAA